RRRSERSAKPFVLMLVRLHEHHQNGARGALIQKLAIAIRRSVRETDTFGWFEEGHVLGIIFTELGDADKNAVLSSLRQRVTKAIDGGSLELEPLALAFTFHFFPEDADPNGHAMDFNLYPELDRTAWPRKFAHTIKRLIDVLGSALALTLLLGLFLLIALLI